MQTIDAIILGVVQGLTEFIPVSSSGHLILVGNFLNFEYSGLSFDTALDIGTLLALAIFFAKDFWNIAHDLIFGGPKRKLGLLMILATIPGVVIGVLIQGIVETVFRSSSLVAINLIWVGILMWLVDKYAGEKSSLSDINPARAIGIGFAQALALMPGVSRSGATITAGRLFGLDRVTATRFSFWLSAPIIAGATAKIVLDGETIREMLAAPDLYLAGIIAAAISGYAAIKLMINYLSRHGLAIFAWYRVLVGVIILVIGG